MTQFVLESRNNVSMLWLNSVLIVTFTWIYLLLHFFNKGKNSSVKFESRNGGDEDAEASDDEDGGMFCSPGFSELVKEKAKQDSGDNIPVYVSKPIVIKEKHQAKSVVTLARGNVSWQI